MTKTLLLLTTIILSSYLYPQATGTITGSIKMRDGRVYPNAKIIFHNKDKKVIADFECGKRISFKESENFEVEQKPLTRWKTQEECNQTEEEAKQAAEKRKEEEARRKEEKRLKEEQRRQELALKKQECEAKGDVWNGRDCRKKSITPVTLSDEEWSEYKGRMLWKDAEAKCSNIGWSWRLPTIEDLKEAYKAGVTKSWAKHANSYWSSTFNQEGSSMYPYYLNTDNGEVSYDSSLGGSSAVRCIRSKDKNRKTQSSKWSEYQGEMNWEDAYALCTRIGMRLPTIKELNESKSFIGSWSSTPNEQDRMQDQEVDFEIGTSPRTKKDVYCIY